MISKVWQKKRDLLLGKCRNIQSSWKVPVCASVSPLYPERGTRDTQRDWAVTSPTEVPPWLGWWAPPHDAGFLSPVLPPPCLPAPHFGVLWAQGLVFVPAAAWASGGPSVVHCSTAALAAVASHKARHWQWLASYRDCNKSPFTNYWQWMNQPLLFLVQRNSRNRPR